LTFKNVSIGIVGKAESFRLLNEEELKAFLVQLHNQEPGVEPMEDKGQH